ncbi:ATP-grasp domain-containing protein [Sphaerospermopsis sp. FACHB-1194]|uniref:ATP-grasp domain-containing protein n=1 Tax=Sphaerospermopsis sp. FACHB-1194 TaxID=2692862 RepID=UPI001681B565|nr:ATP-grasp domain-containing protein [Sphaerospermopsis sp. FACHB-1194]MBD2145849.1 ATP-grasp domain-containing protein [Sphaerospermopsis sp. FACHB-1194]
MLTPQTNLSKSASKPLVLFLGTRALTLERIAEIATAREGGYEIIMASDTPALFQSYGFSHNIYAPLSDYETSTDCILNYINEQNLTICGVIGWQDREEELTSHLTAKLNLPTCELAANRFARNKSATRQLLEELGGKYNPKYACVVDLASFEDAINKIGTPSLLKPAGNSGGRGIVAVRSPENLADIWEHFYNYNAPSQGGLYAKYRECDLLEEMLIGSEHSIAGMVVDGEIYLFAIIDKRIDLGLQLQYENVLPSTLAPEIQDEVREMAYAVMKSTGINWRGFHIDFMVTSHGLRILEIGARPGGECINSHLIPMASSGEIQPYRLLLDYVIQGKRVPLEQQDYTQTFTRRVGSRVIAPPSPGKITRLNGLEKICEHPNTRDFTQIAGVGSIMRPPTEAYEQYKIAYVIAECPLEENLSHIFDRLVSQLEIEISPM